MQAEINFEETIQKFVVEQAERNHQLIEEMCEQSLLTEHGVLVIQNRDGTVTVSISEDIPFGEIGYRNAG